MSALERFTYVADRGFEKINWRVPEITDPRGDCEDYALLAAWLYAGADWTGFWRDQIKFRSVIWLGKVPGGAVHAALWHRGLGWTDEGTRRWRDEPPMRLWFPIPWPMLAVLMAPGWLKLAALVAAGWATWPM